MEIEFFVKPGTELEWHQQWMDYSKEFFVKVLEINQDKLRFREHTPEELAHYSNKTVDIEYLFPFGWGELEGIASRTDYDLKQHMEHSKQDLTYFNQATQERYIPYVVEPSFGVDRTFLTVLVDAYEVEELPDGTKRTLLRFAKHLAPIQIAVLPLKKNEPRIVSQAKEIVKTLRKQFTVTYDDTAAIGKLYRRQDEIGTPYCITVDFDSIEKDHKVTVRNRDSMEQVRVLITDLPHYFNQEFQTEF